MTESASNRHGGRPRGGGEGEGEGGGWGGGARHLALRALTGLLFVQRLLFGLMFTMSGTGWFRYPAREDYLVDAIATGFERGLTFAPYGAFLEAVVVPHPALFVSLVGVGEFLTGLSLLLGFPRRAGAIGAIFLLANYGLAFGGGNFLLMVLCLPLLTPLPYRVFTPIHKLLARRKGHVAAAT